MKVDVFVIADFLNNLVGIGFWIGAQIINIARHFQKPLAVKMFFKLGKRGHKLQDYFRVALVL